SGLVMSSVRASRPTFPVPTCATRIPIFSLRPVNARELFQTLVHYFWRGSCGTIVTLMQQREDVQFASGDDRISAWLYRPTGSGPAPLLVMAHGLGAVRTMRLDAYAERFSAAGYACLVFDYRNFGDSEGQPRQVLDIDLQLADWAAAVAYARTLDGIDPDRIGLWGTSFAGGHVITTAARLPGIAAVVAQCPFTDGIASARTISSPWATARIAAP